MIGQNEAFGFRKSFGLGGSGSESLFGKLIIFGTGCALVKKNVFGCRRAFGMIGYFGNLAFGFKSCFGIIEPFGNLACGMKLSFGILCAFGIFEDRFSRSKPFRHGSSGSAEVNRFGISEDRFSRSKPFRHGSCLRLIERLRLQEAFRHFRPVQHFDALRHFGALRHAVPLRYAWPFGIHASCTE